MDAFDWSCRSFHYQKAFKLKHFKMQFRLQETFSDMISVKRNNCTIVDSSSPLWRQDSRIVSRSSRCRATVAPLPLYSEALNVFMGMGVVTEVEIADALCVLHLNYDRLVLENALGFCRMAAEHPRFLRSIIASFYFIQTVLSINLWNYILWRWIVYENEADLNRIYLFPTTCWELKIVDKVSGLLRK